MNIIIFRGGGFAAFIVGIICVFVVCNIIRMGDGNEDDGSFGGMEFYFLKWKE